MSRLNKVLVGIFCILLLLIVIETTYYVALNNFQNTQVNNSNYNSLATSFKPTMNPSLLASNVDTLKFIGSLKKTTVDSSILNIKLKGSIVNFLILADKDYIQFNISNDGIQKDTLGFGPYRQSKTKVYKLFDGKEVLINIKDLKKGDQITVEFTLDLNSRYGNNVINAKIVKI